MISIRCAASPKSLRAAAGRHSGPYRSAGRKAGAHPAAGNPRRLQPGRALRRAAGGCRRAAQPALQRPRGLARDRRLSPLRRRHASAGPSAHHAAPRRSSDRNPVGLDTRAPDRRHQGNGRAEPDPARERPPPRRRARQHRRRAPTWRRSSARSAASCAPPSCREGFFTSLEGTFQAQEEASRTIGALSLLSLAMIFAILYSRYRSAVLALIIMGSVPLALIGSVAALWIAGQPLSVASMIGFITLTGIAARNGILKISHTSISPCTKACPSGPSCRRASLERLTPVLMTALAAGLALRSAADRCRGAGQGNPASRGGHDLRRPDQRHAARCVSHARLAPETGTQADRAAARHFLKPRRPPTARPRRRRVPTNR